MLTTNTTECLVRPDAPLTWEDVREVSERLGLRPIQHKKKRRSRAASRVHEVYLAWVTRQGLDGSLPVMSLSSAYSALANFRIDGSIIEERAEHRHASREAQKVLVAALNDPSSGLSLVDRPLHKYR